MTHRRVPVEESEVRLAEHDPAWRGHYERESSSVAEAFGPSAVAIEHFGSTSVPGLLAKPIVDILVGSAEGAPPTDAQLDALEARGYEFHGEDGRRPGRWFWRKRGPLSFNLGFVRFGSELWNDNLMLRDYLRAHADEVQRYAAVKLEAQRASPTSVLGYQDGKRGFMEELKARARRWRPGPPTPG